MVETEKYISGIVAVPRRESAGGLSLISREGDARDEGKYLSNNREFANRKMAPRKLLEKN